MTTVKFYKDKNIYTGFECSGHTGFSEEGTDILCSAICKSEMAILKLKF